MAPVMISYTSEFMVGSVIGAALCVAAYYMVVQPRVDGIINEMHIRLDKLDQRRYELATASDFRPSPMELEEASALHAKAWGKQWPQSEGTIDKTEIYDETGSVDDDEIHDLADKLDVPPQFNYRYFKEILSLRRALSANPGMDYEDILVVREDYEKLRRALEDDLEGFDSIVVTGHPGIGTSTFLLYLLLHRLENRLPTAVQFSSHFYVIFDEKGARVNSLLYDDPGLRQCWALTDINLYVIHPCEAFQNLAKRVILASTRKPERWREFIKQTGGYCILSDLPSVPEIAAIAKELRKQRRKKLGKEPGKELEKELLYDPSSTLSLVRKWGPSTRDILHSMKCAALGHRDEIEGEAEEAAIRICEYPTASFERFLGIRMPHSEVSSVIFIRRTPDGSMKLDRGKTFIPTPHLLAIFELQRRHCRNKEFLELFS